MSTPDDLNPSASRIPIIRLWKQLVVSLQGDVTDRQAALLVADVLEEIRQTGARGLVIDISGMWLVDSHLCALLAQLASAAKLMGTPAVLAGMRPEVAMTLQSMGMTLNNIDTALDLEEALAQLGVRVEGHAHGAMDDIPEFDETAVETVDVAGSGEASAGSPVARRDLR